jgi:hypothetical protein
MRFSTGTRQLTALAVAIVLSGLGCASASAAWTVKSNAPPTGAKESKLEGISCANGEICWAVGDYHTTAGVQEPLADSVYGGLELPPTPGKEPQLIAVSCPLGNGEELCMAVGRFINSGGSLEAFAEKHTRTTGWKLQSLTFPSGNTASEIGAVSCPTTTECMAVGDYHNATGEHYLSEKWASGSWTPEAPTEPTGAGYPALTAISCPAAKECIAVGAYRTTPYNPSNQVTETEKWSAGSWSPQGTAMFNPGSVPFIVSDSCITIKKCIGVGYYQGVSVPETMAQEWETAAASGWTQQTSLALSGANELYGVSCWTAITGCVAVGRHVASGVTSALGEELSGTTWTQITLPSITGATASTLDRVSCLEGPLCYAAGYYLSGGKNVMLIERNF